MASRHAQCSVIALSAFMASASGGCSQKEVQCGGRVLPEKLTVEDRAILDKVLQEHRATAQATAQAVTSAWPRLQTVGT